MKNLVSLIFALGAVFSLNVSTPESRPASPWHTTYKVVAFDICVPEVGPMCVCRTCVYNDDGTCSCPAEQLDRAAKRREL